MAKLNMDPFSLIKTTVSIGASIGAGFIVSDVLSPTISAMTGAKRALAILGECGIVGTVSSMAFSSVSTTMDTMKVLTDLGKNLGSIVTTKEAATAE